MKKFITLIIALMVLSVAVNAQYKINKTKYNYRNYVYEAGDPYNPGVAGLCSFLIPGLGQMLSGEAGRGVGFLASEIGFGIIYASGVSKAVETVEYDYNGNSTAQGGGAILIGLAGMLVVDIWSIVDAVHVAKVNDMAWRDRPRSSVNIEPFVNPQYAATGLSMKVQF